MLLSGEEETGNGKERKDGEEERLDGRGNRGGSRLGAGRGEGCGGGVAALGGASVLKVVDALLNVLGDVVLAAHVVVGADGAEVVAADVGSARDVAVVGEERVVGGRGRGRVGARRLGALGEVGVVLALDEARVAPRLKVVDPLLHSLGGRETVVVVGLNDKVVLLALGVVLASAPDVAVVVHKVVVRVHHGLLASRRAVDRKALLLSDASARLAVVVVARGSSHHGNGRKQHNESNSTHCIRLL